MIGALCVFPMGLSLLWVDSVMAVYVTIVICCFVIMTVASVFSVQIMAFVQTETPQNLVGKVISVCIMISMCAHPLGSAMYGLAFEMFAGYEAMVVLFAGVVSLMVAVRAKRVFSTIHGH